MIIKLCEKCVMSLDRQQTSLIHRLEKQTEKAVLLAELHRTGANERKVCYWFPKSQVLVDNEMPWGEIDLQAAKKIEVPDWLWEKRRAT